jgi:hypothetical protein
MEMKKCTGVCGIEKEFTNKNFQYYKRTKILMDQCRDCNIKAYKKQWAEENIEKTQLSKSKYYEKNKKEIIARNKKYEEEHQEKVKLAQKKRYLDNRDAVRAKSKQYYEENKESVAITSKIYRENNKEKIRENKRIYTNNRLKTDLQFKIKHNMSGAIFSALRNRNSSKNGKSFLKYVNFTINELIIRFESLFEWWMTWENRGVYNPKTWDDNDPSTWTWQIDHIIPQIDFNYTSMEDEEFKKCWALENLRPYSAKLNIIEGTNRTRHKKKS